MLSHPWPMVLIALAFVLVLLGPGLFAAVGVMFSRRRRSMMNIHGRSIEEDTDEPAHPGGGGRE